MFITRKIQLLVDSTDKEYISEVYKKLYDWRFICHKAANYIFTHLYIQEQIKELFYLTDEVKVKLADIKKDENGIFTTSKMSTTYQVLSRKFKGDIPMSVLGALNNTLIAYFNKEKQQYFNGERSLRNYKKNIPIPFKIQDIRFLHTSKDGKVFHFKLCNLLFCTYLGKDINDKRVLLEKFTKGEVKLCTSSLMLDKNKIHLLAVFEIEKDKAVLDEGLVAEASLSTEYPLVVTIGKNRYTIGDKEEYMYRRLAIQAAINRKQKAAKYNRNQNGKKRQYRTVTQLKDAERNYVNQKQHVYSKRLIDLCKKHGAGTLLLCNQEENEKEMKETPFLLRNWGYYELKNKIKYKAERAGIVLIEE